jgi:hypothetical protein
VRSNATYLERLRKRLEREHGPLSKDDNVNVRGWKADARSKRTKDLELCARPQPENNVRDAIDEFIAHLVLCWSCRYEACKVVDFLVETALGASRSRR